MDGYSTFSVDEFEALRPLLKQRFTGNELQLGSDESFFDRYQCRTSRDPDISEIYHENSKFDAVTRERNGKSRMQLAEDGRRQFFEAVDPDYQCYELIELPDAPPLDATLDAVLTDRRSRREFGENNVDEGELSALLSYACGKAGRHKQSRDDSRTYPSGGALYPVEVYPLLFSVSGIEPGLYYYSVAHHGLRALSVGRPAIESVEEIFLTEGFEVTDADLVLVFVGNFRRTKSKYGPRGYRFVLLEAGHVTQNVQLVAEALGLHSVPTGGFLDDELDALLGVDGKDEAAIYSIALGGQKN